MVWNRCQYCGRFIGLKEFEENTAYTIHNMIWLGDDIFDEEIIAAHNNCEKEQHG